MEKQIRIDKWLWAVRIFKTRGLAAEACKKRRVLVNGVIAKSSKIIKKDDAILVTKTPVTYKYLVKELIEKRISAKLATNYIENQTPEEELEKLNRPKLPDFANRERGSGRPTKKDRRILDNLKTKL